MRIVLIDNYDSFVHNLARYVREAGHETIVIRTNETKVDDIKALTPAGVIISPGPKKPEDAGISLPYLKAAAMNTPILGVCLGHQCIATRLGGRTVAAKLPLHGQSSKIHHDGRGLFYGLPSPIFAGRYHSLVVELDSESTQIEICARSDEGEIMGIRHRTAPWHGLQFHPESLLTPDGRHLINNFLQECEKCRAELV